MLSYFSPDVTWQPPPSTTLENEHIRSFSRVVFCHNHHHHPTPTNNIHHHPPPSKPSVYTRFRGRWLSSSPPPFPSFETECTRSFLREVVVFTTTTIPLPQNRAYVLIFEGGAVDTINVYKLL